ncbi:MAG: glycosyltransferase, partial [Candidatus Aenigmatarchaeota archaeon]
AEEGWLAAVADAYREFPDVHLTIAGGKHREGSDEYMQRLQETIEENGVEDRVTITGVLPSEDHVNAYIMEADVVALPFDEISQSATLAKTLALGTVPVVTPLDTLRPLIEEYGGIMIEEDAPTQLWLGIQTALRNSEDIHSEKLRHDLSWDRNAIVYDEIYQEVLA